MAYPIVDSLELRNCVLEEMRFSVYHLIEIKSI